jgi:hypothetical protein
LIRSRHTEGQTSSRRGRSAEDLAPGRAEDRVRGHGRECPNPAWHPVL